MPESSIQIFLEKPTGSRNLELLRHLKENMKLYRSNNCQVTVWLNRPERECDLTRREENYPFNVRPIEQADKSNAETATGESFTERLILIREKKVVLELIPSSHEEGFDIKRLVNALLS